MEAAKDGIARSFQVDAMLTRDRFVQQAGYGLRHHPAFP